MAQKSGSKVDCFFLKRVAVFISSILFFIGSYMGRELITSPDLLICFNPTWGLDVGAINYIHETLIKINEKNKSIILISTDTDELLKLSDKISVINKGKLSKIMNADEVTSEKLGVLMGGGEID